MRILTNHSFGGFQLSKMFLAPFGLPASAEYGSVESGVRSHPGVIDAILAGASAVENAGDRIDVWEFPDVFAPFYLITDYDGAEDVQLCHGQLIKSLLVPFLEPGHAPPTPADLFAWVELLNVEPTLVGTFPPVLRRCVGNLN